MKNQPLLPELISRDNDAYPIVEDLKEVLDVAFENKKIKNIALGLTHYSGRVHLRLYGRNQEVGEIGKFCPLLK